MFKLYGLPSWRKRIGKELDKRYKIVRKNGGGKTMNDAMIDGLLCIGFAFLIMFIGIAGAIWVALGWNHLTKKSQRLRKDVD